MNYCAVQHAELIRPYLPKLLACLERDDLHVAAKRNIVRLLQYIEIPKRLHGKAYAHCVDLLVNPTETVAVRAFALTLAARIAQTQPALLHELRLIVRQQLPHSTAAFRVRARKLLAGEIINESDEDA